MLYCKTKTFVLFFVRSHFSNSLVSRELLDKPLFGGAETEFWENLIGVMIFMNVLETMMISTCWRSKQELETTDLRFSWKQEAVAKKSGTNRCWLPVGSLIFRTGGEIRDFFTDVELGHRRFATVGSR